MMSFSDYLGFGVCMAWGLWWVILPANVIRFYRWFHKGKVKLPAEAGIRWAGVSWLVMVGVVGAVTMYSRLST